MKFKIPFTFLSLNTLKSKSNFFSSKIGHKKNSELGSYIKSLGLPLTREEYIGICLRSFLINLIFLIISLNILFMILKVKNFFIYGLILSIISSAFVFYIQISYPKMIILRKQREIEKNLLPALEDILVQLNSGIPLFDILTNIAEGDYGALSEEFKKATKKINAGEPEAEVLNELGNQNPSLFFRRTLWQISNGMNAGSDMVVVIKDSIKNLSEEQLIQIQSYSSKLNPLVVLYMLIGVIIPSLSVTFLTIISSMINLEKNMTILLFLTLFVFDVFFQIMFLGLIKSRRPNLL